MIEWYFRVYYNYTYSSVCNFFKSVWVWGVGKFYAMFKICFKKCLMNVTINFYIFLINKIFFTKIPKFFYISKNTENCLDLISIMI